ncbi:TonB-dependent siderophore receptor [Paracoccus siganidrum]|nr:TonB-dependent siderophore receptor [Paracoccus siganidrum]
MLGASILALSHPALAQEAGEAAPTAASGDQAFILGEIVITASEVAGYFADGAQAAKSSLPTSEASQSISVVTNQQIVDQGAQNLGQALNYTAGINSQPFGIDPRFNNPTMRGFGTDKAQYVNGLRQGRFFGAVDYETYGMQQVEVLRGPTSSLYGSGMPAGVINQVTKRAQSSDFGEAGLSYDSNNGKQVFVDMNRAASDTLSWRLTAIGRDIRPQIDELKNERGYVAGAVRWSPDAATTIDFMASYTRDAPIAPPGIPYGLTELADAKDLRDLYTGHSGWDDSDRRMWNLGLEISHELDSGWTLTQGFRYEKLDWDYTGTYVSTEAVINPDGSFLRGASRQNESSDTISLDTRLSGEVTTGQAIHSLMFGMDVRQYKADESSQNERNLTSFNWLDPDNYGPLPVFTGAPNVGSVKLRQVGLYAQDEITWGNWRASAGLRYDWAKQTGTQYGLPAEFKENEWTGRAGLSYVFDNGLVPYVSYATSFEPQTGLNENEEPLLPTEGKQWEVGMKYQPAGIDGLVSVAVYDLRQTNVNQWAGTSPDGYNLYRQIGEVKSRGVELEATAAIGEAWDVRANFAYNDTKQVGGSNTGQPMWNAPRHTAGVWLDYDFGNGWRTGGGIRYVGSRMDVSNTHELDSFTLVDLGATYARDNFEARLNIANLTDEAYLATCGWFGCYYGEGRTVTATLAYKW